MEDTEEWVTAACPATDDIVDIVAETQAVLSEGGTQTERRGHDLHLDELGLTLSPRGLSIQRGEHMRTVSIIRVSHPAAIPDGLFEYQHGTGADLRDALREGLDLWARVDLPVLCDACREKPETCTFMEMTFPPENGRPERARRVILGPALHWVDQTRLATDQPATEEEHPFCPCCMTTNSLTAFRPLLEADATLGVRLLALREDDGRTSADCRVNGEDFEDGIAALRAYAESWPHRGFEMRKQYVLFQSQG